MKLKILLIFSLLASSVIAQQHLTIFYFGATSCGPCNRSEVVESIKEMKAKFDSVHNDYKTKFVMVCMDENIAEGLKFIQKYGYWNEISIGSWFNNELVLANLNKTDIPAAPHILIYSEIFEKAKYGTVLIKNKELIKEILGGDKIVAWVKSGMELK